MQNALEQALSDVVNEIENCAILKASLEERLRKVAAKMELNSSRMQVRGRRGREGSGGRRGRRRVSGC